MFSQIGHVDDRRIEHHLDLLADIGALLEPVGVRHARAIDEILIALEQLGPERREAFAKDHVVHRWLQLLRAQLLTAYENGVPQSAEAVTGDMLLHFQLALSVLTSADHTFVIREGGNRRFLLPVSGAVIDATTSHASSPIACRYVSASSELEVADGRRDVVRYRQTRGIKIVNSDLDLFFDPTGGQYPVELDESIDISAWETTLDRALNLLESDSVALDLVRKFVTYLVPLKQDGEVKNLSFSARSLPGVIFKNNELTPHLIGETLVHEADHQFFYAIDRINSMWTSDVTLHKAEYYSPWRDDPRPLDGILRGLSSFARVSHYYASLLTTGALQQVDYMAAGTILAKRLGESELALQTVVESKELSAFGLAYVEDIRTVLQTVTAKARMMPGFGDWSSHATAEIDLHRRGWEATNKGSRNTNVQP